MLHGRPRPLFSSPINSFLIEILSTYAAQECRMWNQRSCLRVYGWASTNPLHLKGKHSMVSFPEQFSVSDSQQSIEPQANLAGLEMLPAPPQPSAVRASLLGRLGCAPDGACLSTLRFWPASFSACGPFTTTTRQRRTRRRWPLRRLRASPCPCDQVWD